MTIHIRLATESDAPSIARIGASAFSSSLSPLIFPRSQLSTATITEADLLADEITWRQSMFIKRLREGKPCAVAVEVTAPSPSNPSSDPSSGSEEGASGEDGKVAKGGKIVGFAHWQHPGPEGEEVKGVEVRPATFDYGVFKGVVERFTMKDQEALGERGHEEFWYAILIGVDPSQQGKGIGKKLVHWGLEQARKEGRDAYLTATEAGKPVYERCGFEALDTYDCYGVQLTSMVWRLEKNQQQQ